MKLTLHRIVLFILIKFIPALFDRYYKEYKYTNRLYGYWYTGTRMTDLKFPVDEFNKEK